jgi:hypothetical protein
MQLINRVVFYNHDDNKSSVLAHYLTGSKSIYSENRGSIAFMLAISFYEYFYNFNAQSHQNFHN